MTRNRILDKIVKHDGDIHPEKDQRRKNITIKDQKRADSDQKLKFDVLVPTHLPLDSVDAICLSTLNSSFSIFTLVFLPFPFFSIRTFSKPSRSSSSFWTTSDYRPRSPATEFCSFSPLAVTKCGKQSNMESGGKRG